MESNARKAVVRAAVAACLLAASVFTTTAFSQELPEWVRNIKITGDVGARTEYIKDEKSPDHYDNVRERIRARVGIETSPVAKTKVALGVETRGSASEPRSAWATLKDFQDQPLYLSHVYMQYEASDKLTVEGGKIKGDLAFWKPTQLVWKSEVNPYGVAANYRTMVTDRLDFFANGGVFALTEYRDNDRQIDVPMNAIVVAQPGVEYRLGKLRLKGAFAIQQFSLVNHDTTGWLKANTSYTLVNPSWEIGYPGLLGPYGPMASGEFAKNLHKDYEGETTAYLLSFGFGSARLDKFKTWQFKAAYRRVEANAMPYGMGNTSAYNADPGKGWEYFAGLGLSKAMSLNATFYRMTDVHDLLPQTVSQFDVLYKF